MEWKKIEPDVWKPEKDGDEIEGKLVKIDRESGKFSSTIYHLEKEGKQTVVFGTTVLDDKMKYINEGNSVKIVFRGTQKNTKNQDVKLFDVFKGEDNAPRVINVEV